MRMPVQRKIANTLVFTSAVVTALLAFSVGAPFASAARDHASTTRQSQSITQVGPVDFIFHVPPSDPCCAAVYNGERTAARTFDVNVHLLTPSNYDIPEYVSLVKEALASHPAGVIVSDAYPAAQPYIKQISESGVPVILMNSGWDEVQATGALSYVGQDELLAGQEAGQEMARQGVRYALCLIHAPGLTVLEQRCSGFSQALAAAGGKAVVVNFDGSDPTSAQGAIEGALKSHKGVQGVLALGAEGFDPLIPALKAVGLFGKVKIASFDANPPQLAALKAGQLDFVDDQQLYLEGYLPVEFMALYLRDDVTPVQDVLTGPRLLFKSDVTPSLLRLAAQAIS